MKKLITVFLSCAFFIGFSFSAASAEIPPFDIKNHPEFNESLNKLKTMNVVTEGGITTFGEAWLKEKDYIRVLHVKGAPFEMGYQHGILLKKEILQILEKRASIESYFSFFKKNNTIKYLRNTEPKIPPEFLHEIIGMAAALNVDYDHILAYQLLWELGFGCTIVGARGEATVDRNMMYLRSMENHPSTHKFLEFLIMFYEPESGLPFVSINGPGGVGVYSGMNEQRMAIDDNLVRCLKEDFSSEGMPLFLLRRRILQYANNIEEAQKTIESYPRSSPNNIIIADGKSDEMKVYELGIKKFAVREPENSILCSMNHPQALKLELKYDPKESMARYNFALDFMKKEYGKLSVDKLIEFISTDYIADTNKRILQSIVIMAPKQLDFWVAVQKRDNKQACFNPFLKFNLLEGINK